MDLGFFWGRAPTAKVGVPTFFVKNCMKIKEKNLDPQEGVPGAPLDLPIIMVESVDYYLYE